LRRGDYSKPHFSRLDTMQEKRMAAETRKMEAQASMAEVKTRAIEGFYVERSAFEHALAFRAATFKNDLENWVRADASNIVRLCGGISEKTPDLVDYMLDQAQEFLARYAEDRPFPVPVPVEALLNEGVDAEDEDEETDSIESDFIDEV
jgi:hypothetical protein